MLVDVALVSSKLDKLINGKPKGIEEISNFIKERRKRVNLTQEEFSEKCGIALTVIRKIEQGKTNINLNKLILILSMFGARLNVTIKK